MPSQYPQHVAEWFVSYDPDTQLYVTHLCEDSVYTPDFVGTLGCLFLCV